eukprot:TRINITY_DN5404_c0_g1_i1.p1 TRINITY_DN5404_c0_g1~~TRINITY_DN5404_c0_g1_i1.p1  ORF type:complete len:327 (-),score=88.91 TRINITY_DN5404_c0_g1_i1:108-1088(-)
MAQLFEPRSPRYDNLREFDVSSECVDQFVKAASVNDLAILEQLFKINNCIIDLPSHSRGETALHFATWYGKIEAVQWLVEHGANINSLDRYGYSPLCWAAWRGYLDIAEYLIQYGALEAWKESKREVLVNGKQAQSPMMCIVLRKKEKLLKLFLESEAENVMSLSSSDNCLLLRAATGHFYEGIELMFHYGYDDIGLGAFGDECQDESNASTQQQEQQQQPSQQVPQQQQQQQRQAAASVEEDEKLDIHRENYGQFQRLVEQDPKLAESIRNGLQANRTPKMSLLGLAMKCDPQCALGRLSNHPEFDANITREFMKFMSLRMLQQL